MPDARRIELSNGHSFGYPFTAWTGAEIPFVLFGRILFIFFAENYFQIIKKGRIGFCPKNL